MHVGNKFQELTKLEKNMLEFNVSFFHDKKELQDVPILDQISTVVRDAIKLVIVNVGLLVLHLVPVIGSVAAVWGSFYFDFLILGSEFLVFSLDLRGRLRVGAIRRFAARSATSPSTWL